MRTFVYPYENQSSVKVRGTRSSVERAPQPKAGSCWTLSENFSLLHTETNPELGTTCGRQDKPYSLKIQQLEAEF